MSHSNTRGTFGALLGTVTTTANVVSTVVGETGVVITESMGGLSDLAKVARTHSAQWLQNAKDELPIRAVLAHMDARDRLSQARYRIEQLHEKNPRLQALYAESDKLLADFAAKQKEATETNVVQMHAAE